MKILLSYSRFHFDPTKSASEQPLWGTSANVLARTLYDLLSKKGKVTYIDPSEAESVRGKSFDLFVGQVSAFHHIVKVCSIKKSVYFAVNMHPSSRNKIISSFMRSEGLSSDVLSDEFVDERDYRRSLEIADYVISIGNMVTYNSYVDNGVPRKKIKMFNYSTGEALSVKELKIHKKAARTYLYLASDIGLRKGFDTIIKIVGDLNSIGKPYKLHIIGKPKVPYYQNKLDQLLADNPDTIIYHGWVKVGSKKFVSILQDCDITLFPSLEEAQAGSVLDAMRQGVIPLISRATCSDYSPLGWLDPHLTDTGRRAIIRRSISLTSNEINALRKKTLKYYHLFHDSFIDQLDEALNGVIKDQLYPLVSVTLPIFNKQATIAELLGKFDRAAKAYGNIELHIIFDGCRDNTEKVVRRFFAHHKAYPVTYKTTPDIFEVKTNNIGLKKSKGVYCTILQDDNYINDPTVFLEAVSFLERATNVAILGGLAGVNFYPRGTKGLKGTGQIAMSDNEVYWRQDAKTDPTFENKILEVDACMRGPLFIRNSFLKKHGYLDEAYVPFYQDDMDLAFRARKYGYTVFAILLDVENRAQTVAAYNPVRQKFWDDTMKKNTDIFYKRWTPTTEKDYLVVNRVRIPQTGAEIRATKIANQKRRIKGVAGKLKKAIKRG